MQFATASKTEQTTATTPAMAIHPIEVPSGNDPVQLGLLARWNRRRKSYANCACPASHYAWQPPTASFAFMTMAAQSPPAHWSSIPRRPCRSSLRACTTRGHLPSTRKQPLKTPGTPNWSASRSAWLPARPIISPSGICPRLIIRSPAHNCHCIMYWKSYAPSYKMLSIAEVHAQRQVRYAHVGAQWYLHSWPGLRYHVGAYLTDPGRRGLGLKDQAFQRLGIVMTPISQLIGTGSKTISMSQVPIRVSSRLRRRRCRYDPAPRLSQSGKNCASTVC